MPITYYAIMDKEMKGSELKNRPHLYIAGKNGEVFNSKKFWKEILSACY